MIKFKNDVTIFKSMLLKDFEISDLLRLDTKSSILSKIITLNKDIRKSNRVKILIIKKPRMKKYAIYYDATANKFGLFEEFYDEDIKPKPILKSKEVKKLLNHIDIQL